MFNDEIPMMMEREAGMPENVAQVLVGFCLFALQNDTKTEEAGRAIFDDRDFVRIMVPGDKNSVIFQPATELHKRRFPRAWEAYQRQTTVALSGTPLEHWPMLTRAQALNFKAANIPTVEALAEVSDSNLDKLGTEARTWREKAKAFLAAAKDSAAEQKLAKENAELRDLIGAMQEQIKLLADNQEKATGVRPDTAMPVRARAKSEKPTKAKRRR